MKKINTKKVKALLLEKGAKQIELARSIGMKTTGLSAALSGQRPMPMAYVFDVAAFFGVEPLSITLDDASVSPSEKSIA